MHVATGLALLLWARGGPAASQDALGISPEASKFPIDDADPERSIPGEEEAARDPLQMGYLIVALTNRAQEALQQGQPARAAKYFRALGKASPGRALPFRKACAAYESAGEIASAIDMCRAALGKIDATANDRLDFLDVALKKPGELTRAELSDIDGTIARLQRELTKDKADKAK